jgi:hypothetical protein
MQILTFDLEATLAAKSGLRREPFDIEGAMKQRLAYSPDPIVAAR